MLENSECNLRKLSARAPRGGSAGGAGCGGALPPAL